MRRWPWKLENAAEREFYKASKWKDVPCSQVRTLNTAKRAIFSNWSTDSGRSLLKSGLFWWKWHEDPRLHVERQGTQDPKQPWGKLFWLESTHLSSRLNYELEWTRPHNRGARLGMQASEHGWESWMKPQPTASWVSTRRPALFNVQTKVFSTAPRCWDATCIGMSLDPYLRSYTQKLTQIGSGT